MPARVLRACRRRASLCAVILGLASSGFAPASEPLEWEREASLGRFFVSPLDAEGVPTHVVARVVDDATGQSVAGASVTLRSESEFPVTGLVAADRTGFTDEDGWVRIRADDLGWTPSWTSSIWLYVEAAGFAGAVLDSGLGPDGEEIRLQRAQDVAVRVCDLLGRPVAGAVLGVRDSRTCGHMPDQRIAVSDLDGLAVLPSLCAPSGSGANEAWECWVMAESLESDYVGLDLTPEMLTPQAMRFGPSYPVLGTLVDGEGRPVAGAYVGGSRGHRGPWAQSDADGDFRLIGVDPVRDTLRVVQVYDGMYAKDRPADTTFIAAPRGIRRIVRLPQPGEPPAAEAMLDVEITALEKATGDALPLEPIVAWRDGDGWTARGVGRLTALPCGAFTVEAGGGPSAFASQRIRIAVGDAPAEPHTLKLVRHPEIEIDCRDDPARVALRLVTPDGDRWLGEEEETVPRRVAVPPDVPCALVAHVTVEGHSFEEMIPIPTALRAQGAPPLLVHATRKARVTARLVDPNGRRLAGWLVAAHRVDELVGSEGPDDLGPPSLEPVGVLYAEGPVVVVAIAEGGAHLAQRLTVALPAGSRGGAAIELGDVQLGPHANHRLSILDAHGSPIQAERITCWRGARAWDIELDEHGVHDDALTPLKTGDEIVVTALWDASEYAAREARWLLEGPGPWVLRDAPLGASVAVEARDEDGNRIPVVVVVDGKAHRAHAHSEENGGPRAALIRSVAPGPHRVEIAAPNFVTRICHVVLGAGETRHIAVKMRRMPYLDGTMIPDATR